MDAFHSDVLRAGAWPPAEVGSSGKALHSVHETILKVIAQIILQGLDFLGMACESEITCHLSDEDFIKLKESIGQCVCHIVGSLDHKNLKVTSPATVPLRLSRMSGKF